MASADNILFKSANVSGNITPSSKAENSNIVLSGTATPTMIANSKPSSSSELPEFVRAIKNYAAYHKLPEGQVTIAEVLKGVKGWAETDIVNTDKFGSSNNPTSGASSALPSGIEPVSIGMPPESKIENSKINSAMADRVQQSSRMVSNLESSLNTIQSQRIDDIDAGSYPTSQASVSTVAGGWGQFVIEKPSVSTSKAAIIDTKQVFGEERAGGHLYFDARKIARDNEQRLRILRRLFVLLYVNGVKVTEENNGATKGIQPKAWPYSLGSTMCHGGRVLIYNPKGKIEDILELLCAAEVPIPGERDNRDRGGNNNGSRENNRNNRHSTDSTDGERNRRYNTNRHSRASDSGDAPRSKYSRNDRNIPNVPKSKSNPNPSSNIDGNRRQNSKNSKISSRSKNSDIMISTQFSNNGLENMILPKSSNESVMRFTPSQRMTNTTSTPTTFGNSTALYQSNALGLDMLMQRAAQNEYKERGRVVNFGNFENTNASNNNSGNLTKNSDNFEGRHSSPETDADERNRYRKKQSIENGGNMSRANGAVNANVDMSHSHFNPASFENPMFAKNNNFAKKSKTLTPTTSNLSKQSNNSQARNNARRQIKENCFADIGDIIFEDSSRNDYEIPNSKSNNRINKTVSDETRRRMYEKSRTAPLLLLS